MDDDDEFDNAFFDIDDEAAIALLNQEESKFAATQRVDQSPPSKRQKLDHRNPSLNQFSQVPIVLGLEDDYFTRSTGPAVHHRSEPPAPAPPPARQNPPPRAPAPANNSHTARVSTSANQSRVQSFQPQARPPPQPQPQPPRRPGEASGPHQRVVSDPQRSTGFSKHSSWTGHATNVNVTPPPNPPPKPRSTGQPQPSRPVPLQQHALHRQHGYNTPTTAPARSSVAGPSTRQHSPQLARTSSFQAQVPQAQVPNQQTPEAFRQNSLKRQHSRGAFVAQQNAPRPSQGGGNGDARVKLELRILQAQLDEMKAREAEWEQRVKAAEDARWAKEGEVSILRASIAKSTQDHAADIARLQAAREAAEAGKLQLMREQKEEIERLKTQFTFRQHELETSSRKPPWSAQGKKTYTTNGRGLPTPVKMPPAMRAWNNADGGSQPAGPSVAQTPRRPRVGGFIDSPEALMGLSKRGPPAGSQQPARPAPALPGFYNSFANAGTPTKPRHAAREKGKERFREPIAMDEDTFFAPPPERQRSPPSSPLGPGPVEPEDHPMEDLALSSQAVLEAEEQPQTQVEPEPEPVHEDEDVNMEGDNEEVVQDEAHEVEAPNWRDELHRLLFAHTAREADVPTLQTLLHFSLPSSASPELQQTYMSACARIMEQLGLVVKPADWDAYMRVFSDSLLDIASVLSSTGAFTQLSALSDLLCMLCYTIPSFAATLLQPPSANTPPRILAHINQTIRTHLSVAEQPEDDEKKAKRTLLARATLSLIEAVSWNIPEDLVSQLSVVIRGHDILTILLHEKQPTPVLTHVIRTLALLATHPTLFRHLLAFPYAENGEEQTKEKDLTKLPHIITICNYLCHPNHDKPDNDELRDNIITLLSTLALIHQDALTILLKSRTLIPSIVVYLSNICTPIWEDEDTVLTRPGHASRLVERTVRAIALLYHMTFTPNPPFDLHPKLHRPVHRHLMGVAHMFTVTMGRCGFADLPEWLDEDDYVKLDQATGMAKLLLGSVVDGEDLDAIWTVFNIEEPAVAAAAPKARAAYEVDEEESEAWRLHPAADDDMEDT